MSEEKNDTQKSFSTSKVKVVRMWKAPRGGVMLVRVPPAKIGDPAQFFKIPESAVPNHPKAKGVSKLVFEVDNTLLQA